MLSSRRLRALRESLPDAISGLNRILRLTSTSEQLTPAELSMKSVLMRPPASAYSMRPRCGYAEVAALADDAAAQFGTVDAHRVVGAVADFRVRLVGGFHVGADAAVPEQVDRQPEDRADDVVRRGRRQVDAEQGARLGRQRHRLLLPRVHAATLRNPAQRRSPPSSTAAAQTCACARRSWRRRRARGR